MSAPDPGTGLHPGNAHTPWGHRGAGDPADGPRDLVAEVLRLADRLDHGADVPERGLDLEAAADAVQALRPRGGRPVDLIREAERAVAKVAGDEIAASQTRLGSASASLMVPKLHMTGLREVDDLSRGHERAREAIERDDTLSDIGRKKKLVALNEKTATAADELTTKYEVQLDKHIESRRSKLEKQFAVPAPPEPDAQELLLRAVQVNSLLLAWASADLGSDELRLAVSTLVESGSVLAATALRALALLFALDPAQLASFVAAGGAAERGVAIERMLARPEMLAAAVEWAMLRRSLVRIRSEWAALAKSISSADIFINAWEKDLSTVSPLRGAA
jgi:hypothetical protein